MLISLLVLFFFFSSRRRHTRCLSDWSSDVCSSDLPPVADAGADRTIAYQDQFNDARGFFIGGPGGSDPDSHALRFERSEEHTSELQSLRHLVCRLLLEKKKKK